MSVGRVYYTFSVNSVAFVCIHTLFSLTNLPIKKEKIREKRRGHQSPELASQLSVELYRKVGFHFSTLEDRLSFRVIQA